MILIVGCWDQTIPKENDLQKYPQLRIFMADYTDFKGIKHDLDLGEYSFSFKTKYSSIEQFFKITDSSAINNDWEVLKKTDKIRMYKKKSMIYSAATGDDIVTLTFKPTTNRIKCFYSVNKIRY